MSLVELMVAISILALIMTGIALSVGVNYKAVALARSRQVAESVANKRLEELRDVDYATLALDSQPVHSTDSTNPDYYVSTDGLEYDVDGAGNEEALIVDTTDGPVSHLETPVTVGTTVVDVYQYVTWVDDASIPGTQNLKRISVVVTYHSVPHFGLSKLLRESVILTPGNVTLPSTETALSASFTYAAASSPADTIDFTDTSTGSPTSWQWDFDNDGTTDSTLQNPSHTFPGTGDYPVTLTVASGSDTSTATDTVSVTTTGTTTTTLAASACGSFSIAGSSGADVGYTASATVTITMAFSSCGSVIVNFSNDGGATWGADVDYSATATTLAWTLSGGNGTKTISGRARNGASGTPWDVASQSIVLDTIAPTSPTSISRTLSCSGSTRTVTLNWGASTDTYLVGYHVYVSGDGATFSLLASTSSLSYTTTNAKTSTPYYYVKGYDSAGNESSASSTIAVAKNKCS